MTRSRYKIFETQFPYFVTGTIIEWHPLFKKPEIAQCVLESMTFMHTNNRITIYAYVIMENHFHLIAQADKLSEELGNFKAFIARKIIKVLKKENDRHTLQMLADGKLSYKNDREHQVWQEGSHPEQIQSPEMMRQKMNYIHYNPVRRGYVDDPVHWRYSSARNYAGQDGLVPVCIEW
jgi:putative transposase